MTTPCIPGLFGPPVRPAERPIVREKARQNATAWRVLAALKVAGTRGCTNVELSTPEIGGLRAVGRIHDLRQDGWAILKAHERGGVWRYTLMGWR